MRSSATETITTTAKPAIGLASQYKGARQAASCHSDPVLRNGQAIQRASCPMSRTMLGKDSRRGNEQVLFG